MPHRAGARRHRAELIGIDDAIAWRDCHGTMSRALDPKAAAAEYAGLFPSVYLRFHRRTGKRRELSGVSRGEREIHRKGEDLEGGFWIDATNTLWLKTFLAFPLPVQNNRPRRARCLQRVQERE